MILSNVTYELGTWVLRLGYWDLEPARLNNHLIWGT